MTSSLGEAVLDLSADDAQLQADVDKAGDAALKKLGEFGKKMQSVGKNMTKALTLPLIGMGTFAVKEASDLEESVNAVNVIFGESSDVLYAFGENAATQVGLAKSEFNELGAVTGAFLTNLGYDQAAAAEETINLTERAADMASVFGGEVSGALAAIQSGLKGEFNPLERFGVKMNAATIEAKAMSMGLVETNVDMVKVNGLLLDLEKATEAWSVATAEHGDTSLESREALQKYEEIQQKLAIATEGNTGVISDNAKAQAALALIYEQTNKVQGDFLNTSDGLANSMRSTKAQLTDAAGVLGEQLLPLVTQAVQWFSQLIAKFQGLSPEQQRMILLVGGAVAALGPLLMIIGSLITAFSAIIPVIGAVGAALSPFLLPILAIIAAIGLLYLAWTNNWGGIQEKAQAVWDYIQPILQMVWDWLMVNIPLALQVLADFWTNVLLPAITAVWGWISSVLFPLFESIANFLGAVFGVALTALAGIWQNVLAPALQAVWEWLSEKLSPAFEALSEFWTNTLQPILQKIAEWIGEKVSGAFENLTEKIRGVTDWLNNMAELLRGLSLPDWMTPGSPTPWEIGLVGVDKALRSLSNASLPSLSSSLGALPSPAVANGVSVGGGGAFVFNYQPMLSTADEYEAKRVLGPFIEGKMRELSKR